MIFKDNFIYWIWKPFEDQYFENTAYPLSIITTIESRAHAIISTSR